LVRICGLLGITRQAYYQHFWCEQEISIEEQLILEQVRQFRKGNGLLGGRKLYCMLQPFLLEHQIKIGRDALFNTLADNHLLVRRRHRKAITTNSRHWLRKYPNLIREFTLTHPNQVWVSDITYLRTTSGFVYISFITDAYSHKIVGYQVADNLEAIHSIKALIMALAGIRKPIPGLIHHSDRGTQYCSSKYVKVLQDYQIQISMCEKGDPLENAVAERVNGIIKTEYFANTIIEDRSQVESILEKAVNNYNTERPHMSCSMLTPDKVHRDNITVKRTWKNYYLRKTVQLSKKSPESNIKL
jgi:transposase InsO family protein